MTRRLLDGLRSGCLVVCDARFLGTIFGAVARRLQKEGIADLMETTGTISSYALASRTTSMTRDANIPVELPTEVDGKGPATVDQTSNGAPPVQDAIESRDNDGHMIIRACLGEV